MRRQSDSNQLPFLQWILRLLRLVGAYRKKKNITSYFTVLSLLLAVILQGADISLNWNGIESLKKARYLPACVVAAVKGILLINANELLEVIAMLKNFWRADAVDSNTQKKVDNIFQFVTTICRLYFICCYSLGVIMIIIPLLNLEKKTLALSDYPLCDYHGNVWCWVALYLWQSFVMLAQIGPIEMSFDCIFIICTGYIYNGCELLKAGLKGLNIEDRQDRQRILRQTVQQHNVILNFVKKMDDMFTEFMLIQVCCSLCSLILMLYMMVADGTSKADRAIYGAMYIFYACELLFYSHSGTIIQDQLNSIPFAIYEVDWYSKDRTDLRKDLAFMIMRSQNVRILSVGKLTDLNLPLFLATIRASISYVGLIRQFDNNGGYQ